MSEISLLEELKTKYGMHQLSVSTVDTEISPRDLMYQGNKHHYFSVGFSALDNMLLALSSATRAEQSVGSILDFPSGYGRVLRFIRAYFPQASITASELETEATDFLRERFTAEILDTHKDFREIRAELKFDLIWCGSLITHLDMTSTMNLLDFFYRALADGGVLVFSSLGRYSSKLLRDADRASELYGMKDAQRQTLMTQFEEYGYGYQDYQGVQGYGISIIRPSWFMHFFERNERFRVVLYRERGWDNHHDIVACVKLNADELRPQDRQ